MVEKYNREEFEELINSNLKDIKNFDRIRKIDLIKAYQKYEEYMDKISIIDSFSHAATVILSLKESIIGKLPNANEMYIEIGCKMNEVPCLYNDKLRGFFIAEYPSYVKKFFTEKLDNQISGFYHEPSFFISDCAEFFKNVYSDALDVSRDEEKRDYLIVREKVVNSIDQLFDENEKLRINIDYDKICNYFFILKEEIENINTHEGLLVGDVKNATTLMEAVELVKVLPNEESNKKLAYSAAINLYIEESSEKDTIRQIIENNHTYYEFKKDVFVQSKVGDNNLFLENRLLDYSKYLKKDLSDICMLGKKQENHKVKVKENKGGNV